MLLRSWQSTGRTLAGTSSEPPAWFNTKLGSSTSSRDKCPSLVPEEELAHPCRGVLLEATLLHSVLACFCISLICALL